MFSSYHIGNMTLKNRIVRSATYEGACDAEGYPGISYSRIYKTLAMNEVGMIITGFAFVSKAGRAMQTRQAGIDKPEKIEYFKKVTDEIHKYGCRIVMQIAHTGRQTLEKITNSAPLSSTTKPSLYFRQKPRLITEEETEEIIGQFAESAYLAKEAGFDGVQLHAAHGYLLHQFLLPETNILKNRFGIDKKTGLGTALPGEVFDAVKARCGDSFPVLVKISGDHNLPGNFFPDKFDNLIRFLNEKRFDAIEISYGTMDYALNIFRGDINLDKVFTYNPMFRTDSKLMKTVSGLCLKKLIISRFIKFAPAYNLRYAERAKKLTDIPVISVGGFRNKNEIESAIKNNSADLIALSRPFICEPDLAKKFMEAPGDYESQCKNCNDCVFMCDSGRVTTCYSKK